LAVFVLTLLGPIILYNIGHLLAAASIFFGGIVLFIILLIRHGFVLAQCERAQKLLDINLRGLARAQDAWWDHPENGSGFLVPTHAYAIDLDIFGSRSLFQWITSAHSPPGQQALASFLTEPAEPELITKRQKALAELSPRLDWRQNFEASTLAMAGKEWDHLIAWGICPEVPWFSRYPYRLIRLLPLVGLVLGLVGYAAGAGWFPLALWLGIQFSLGFFLSGSLKNSIATAIRQRRELQSFAESLCMIEGEKFSSELNQAVQLGAGAKGCSASREIQDLETALGWLEMRSNPVVHLILNSLFLWDLQWAIRAETWRRRNGSRIQSWLDSVAQFEALASLAHIHFENPDWPFPTIHADKEIPFRGMNLGHPLLPAKSRVSNDFEVPRKGSIALITGSNMSGKSTFLRSVGVNLVLAYAGAPVCAAQLECAWMPIHTSMRVTDDLGSGVSSFYAELLRVKMIIDASRERTILCLIDEIFRGTNSTDRLAGAAEVLKTLTALQTIGLVSTHDLELSRLADESPDAFRNYHFSEQYSESGIEFDYKLKPGKSRTTNALFLMRKLGIMNPALGASGSPAHQSE
jgi:hypothetical protein